MSIQKDSSPHDDLAQHIARQIAEINSPFNHHITREKLGREPTPAELAMNYICCGGAKACARKYDRDIEGADLAT